MPKLTNEEIQKIESFLAKKNAKSCPFCDKGPILAKQDIFLSIHAGFDNKALNVVVVQCKNCHHMSFFNYDSIIKE